MLANSKVHIINSSRMIDFEFSPPAKCPHCDTAYYPAILDAYGLERHSVSSDYKVFVLFYCPACNDCFIARYTRYPSGDSFFINTSPKPEEFQPITFDDRVKEISPMFCEIYTQSHKAETEGLTEICGMGYRRALEFLIKDYLISRNPEDVEQIKSQPLSQSIQLLDNEKIRTLSQKATWLGNDHSHYITKHLDRDVHDLKSFITAASYFISMSLILDDAESVEPM